MALLLALVTYLALTHSGRTAVRTLFFLPEMFPDPPVRPITWISPTPHCDVLSIAYADTESVGDLCVPTTAGTHGALLLTLGVHPLDREDPFLVRFHNGLTRTNVAVLRVQSPDLSSGRIAPREIDGLVTAYQTLQAQPNVDPERVALAGFSVGGSLSLVAAADPRIRDQVRLVYSFGGYHDALSVLGAVTDRRIRADGVERVWEPHHWTVHVFAEQIVNALPEDDEQAYLRTVLADAEGSGPPPLPLSTVGDMVYRLLTDGGGVDGEALLAALPTTTRDTFVQLSPAVHLANIRAPLHIMHDVGDTLIPYTESRALVARLPPDLAHRYAEFRMFEHVTPRDPGELLGALPEVAQLYRELYAVFLALGE